MQGRARQLDRLGQDLFSSMSSGLPASLNVYRNADRYVLDADLPGVDPRSIEITVEDQWLTIRAERSANTAAGDAQWLVRERTDAKVTQRLMLSHDMDPDGIEATYRDGVLSVTIPMAEGTQRHKVPVALGSSERSALGAGGSGSRDAVSGKADAAHSLAS
jgi:HSP20 family protein